jgi:catechol 2,3-dioxygenase-like lactoylglutathione lyase family enzyme
MKRFHVNMRVADIEQSVRFYSVLFAAPPSVVKSDYANWMLEDPRVNFSISTHGGAPGIDHLGIQVESEGELHEVYGRLQAAERPVIAEGATTCCYAKSEKSWVLDPQGVSWETFLTSGESTVYGDSRPNEYPSPPESTCCAPAPPIAAPLPAMAAACCVNA